MNYVKNTMCRCRFIWAAFVFFMSTALINASAAAEVVLVENGESRAVIVLPEEPQEGERMAAEELAEHLALISGVELEVVSAGEEPEDLLPIYLGGAADAGLDELTLEQGSNISSFTLRVTEERIDIRGIDHEHATLKPTPEDRGEGTLFGAYELLEQLGVRWYIPGEIGRVLPEESTLSLNIQQQTQVPSMDYRRIQHITAGEWPARARLGGERRSTGSHNLPGKADDQRGTEGGQVCVSGDYNPGAMEMTIEWIRDRYEPTDEKFYVGMGPRDGGMFSYCECDGCRALDRDVWDPLAGAVSVSDRYVWFFNKVLEELEDEYPNMHITWYVYQRHMMPPQIQPNPRIVHVFAPILLERIRSMDNPMAMDRQMLRWVIERWADTGPNEMYYRGYFNFLACVQMPKTQLDRVRNDIPALYEYGVNVMRVSAIRHSWAGDPLTLYVATRLMWDVETDVDALLEEFYSKFYGPAEAPMRRYHQQLEAAFRDTPYAVGGSYSYMPVFLGQPRRDELRDYLYQARAMVEEGTVYADRMDMIMQGYRRMDMFLDMIKARNQHNFAAATVHLQNFLDISDEMIETVLEGEDARRARDVHRFLDWEHRSDNRGAFINRFWRDAVESGYRRTVSEGELVAPLPDEWLFRIDPSGIGKQLMFDRPGELGGIWKPMKTSSRTWGDQGLYHFRGEDARGWYRASVHIPEEFEGRPIYLWFAGVDQWAEVWINGQYVGRSTEPREGIPGVPGSHRPFDMPATDAVEFGEENWVVVKTVNDALGELGTGGIVGPAMFWSPHDAEWMP